MLKGPFILPDKKEATIASGVAVDVELLREGFNRGFADYRYNMQMDPAAARAYMGCAGIAAEDCAVLIAEERGRPHGVGAALLAVRGEDGWCGGLSVAPEYRRQGWGRRLMEQLRRRAQERGLRRVRLEVRTENDHARSVYRQVGYEPVRELLLWEPGPATGAPPSPFRTARRKRTRPDSATVPRLARPAHGLAAQKDQPAQLRGAAQLRRPYNSGQRRGARRLRHC